MRNIVRNLSSLAALIVFGAAVLEAAPVDKRDLDIKNLSQLEERAESAGDHQQLARLYQLRAEMLEEKAQRHKRLEKRYAAAPASLLAKRGSAWNTPKRQRQLARIAERQASDARRAVAAYTAKAESLSIAVD